VFIRGQKDFAFKVAYTPIPYKNCHAERSIPRTLKAKMPLQAFQNPWGGALKPACRAINALPFENLPPGQNSALKARLP
jgi:hypothetical protein